MKDKKSRQFGETLFHIRKLAKRRDVESLIAELSNPAEHQISTARGSAARFLGRIGDRRAAGPLRELLADPNETVRTAAAQALGRIGDREAVPDLVKALDDPSDAVQWWAAWSLGKIGDPAAVRPLLALVSRESWDVRSRAAEALGRLGVPAAIEPLRQALAREEGFRWRRPFRKALRRLLKQARGRP